MTISRVIRSREYVEIALQVKSLEIKGLDTKAVQNIQTDT